jgi:hypothetical protein
MKISFALVIATTLVFFQMPARASTIYPTQRWCRVYDDTSFVGIPGQCGTTCRSTRANCTCDLRERHRIIITQIIIAHSNGGS